MYIQTSIYGFDHSINVLMSINLSGYTTAARSVLPFVTAVAQQGFLALVNKCFALNAQSYHFSSSSNERMTNLVFGVAFIGRPLLGKDRNACYLIG